MEGRRVYFEDRESFNLSPGDYGKHPGNGQWYCCTPNGHMGGLRLHQVTEHENGTITVSPSILVSTSDPDTGRTAELWHGFLERGVWRAC